MLKRAAEREIALAMRGRKIYNGKRISRIEKDGGEDAALKKVLTLFAVLRRAARRERERTVPVLRHGDPAAGTKLGHQRHSRHPAGDRIKSPRHRPRK